jgi:hypothetical protein
MTSKRRKWTSNILDMFLWTIAYISLLRSCFSYESDISLC